MNELLAVLTFLVSGDSLVIGTHRHRVFGVTGTRIISTVMITRPLPIRVSGAETGGGIPDLSNPGALILTMG